MEAKPDPIILIAWAILTAIVLALALVARDIRNSQPATYTKTK